MSKIISWNELKASDVASISIGCGKCGKINTKIHGEDLNCDFCGNGLLNFNLKKKDAECILNDSEDKNEKS